MVSTSSARGPGGHFWALSWKLKLAAILAFLVLLFIGGTALLNAYNYSIGTRTGVIDKLSTKGFVCWTMEGQLALPNFSKSGALRPGNDNLDNTFYFSVPDKEVQKQIEAIPPGSPVTLEYHQKLFTLDLPIPFLCLRRTEYEIVGVKPAPAYPSTAPIPMRP
jgi:hypothetical protein